MSDELMTKAVELGLPIAIAPIYDVDTKKYTGLLKYAAKKREPKERYRYPSCKQSHARHLRRAIDASRGVLPHRHVQQLSQIRPA